MFIWKRIQSFFCIRCYPIPKTLEEDNWKNEWYYVKVIDCYDGDTCTVAVYRNGKWWKQKIRMMGYDTPEMKPPLNQPNREKEIELANISKKAFMDKVMNKFVWMHTHEREKYGRILASFYLPTCFNGGRDTKSVNQWMIENKFGKTYDGGTKDKNW